MLKKDLILKNPLRLMGRNMEDLLPAGGFGAVLARAGVGKTAMLVQLALNALLRDIHVLHISLNDPVKKVALWYQEMFRHLAAPGEEDSAKAIWEALLPQRFIMTFKVEGFSVPKLEERLADLSEQNIFSPRMIVIDGLPFDGLEVQQLKALKKLARECAVHVWFAVTTHRHEAPGPDGIPLQLRDVATLFELIVQLQPEGKRIQLKPVKGLSAEKDPGLLILDPATMLLVENG